MGIVYNYIRYIYISRSKIWTQTNLVWWDSWINMRWYVVMRMWWHAWIRFFLHAWIIIIRIILMYIFSMHTPWNSFLRKPWVGNVYSTMVICRKLDDVIPMSTYVITITMKTILSTMIALMMVGRRAGPRLRSTSPNSINTFSNIEQVRVVDLFVPTPISCNITPTISSLLGRVDIMGPISKSPITTNSIS